MTAGYQIIEPVGLAGLIGEPRNFVGAVIVLEWLVSELRLELPQLSTVRLEVIRVEYVGAYPALGVQYPSPAEDLAPLIEATIERLLAQRPVSRLVDFMSGAPDDWITTASRLLGPR